MVFFASLQIALAIVYVNHFSPLISSKFQIELSKALIFQTFVVNVDCCNNFCAIFDFTSHAPR